MCTCRTWLIDALQLRGRVESEWDVVFPSQQGKLNAGLFADDLDDVAARLDLLIEGGSDDDGTGPETPRG